jgi:hypothetical protein
MISSLIAALSLSVPGSACDIDFNNDGRFPDVGDVTDLLNVFGGGTCSTASCDSLDINGDGMFPDNNDIETFYERYSTCVDNPSITWADLTPRPGAFVYYLDPTHPSASDSGPCNSPSTPCKTEDAAYRKLRSGSSDQLRIARGSDIAGRLGVSPGNNEPDDWRKSGASPQAPMVVTSYGNPDLPPPIIRGGAMMHVGSSNWIISGIDFRGTFKVLGNCNNWVLEDTEIRDVPGTGLVVEAEGLGQGPYYNAITNGVVRGFVIRNCYGGSASHSQGTYLQGVDNLLLEYGVLYRNGWDPARGRDGTATGYNQNAYVVAGSDRITLKNVWSIEPAAGAIQLRGNASSAYDCAVLGAPLGIGGGHPLGRWPTDGWEGTIERCVVLDGAPFITSSLPRGFGIGVVRSIGGTVRNNVVANCKGSREAGLYFDSDSSARCVVENNVVWNWDGAAVQFRRQLQAAEVVRNNIFAHPASGAAAQLYVNVSSPGGSLSGNVYWGSPVGKDANNQPKDIGWWRQFEPTAELRPVNFPPFTAASWLEEQGISGLVDPHGKIAQFAAQSVRKNSENPQWWAETFAKRVRRAFPLPSAE